MRDEATERFRGGRESSYLSGATHPQPQPEVISGEVLPSGEHALDHSRWVAVRDSVLRARQDSAERAIQFDERCDDNPFDCAD